jgi:predicted permease
MDALRADLRYALRVCRRAPGTTAVAVVALALGIGLNTTVFSFVSALLLRPLPYPDSDRIVMLWQDRSAKGGPAREVFSPGLFIDWSTRATAVRDVAAIRGWAPSYAGRGVAGDDEAERLTGAAVSVGYFKVLGVAPALGRVFGADDDRPAAAPVVVLSHALWQRRFASDAAIVGQVIQFDGQPAQVIGVMPDGFHGAVIDADVWMPARIDPANAPRGIILLRAIARLAPGVTVAQAQASFATLQAQIAREDPELVGARARVVTLQDDVVGPARPVLLVLSASVGLVLLIACANVTSILMARAAERRVEMAVRTALGADRWRLIRQLLTESAVLAIAGSVAGLALSAIGLHLLVAAAPADAPRMQDVAIDGGVLAFTAAVTILAAIAAGLAPVVAGWRPAVSGDLREGAREARGFSYARAALVVAEVAAAMALTTGAGLFTRSLVALERVDLGFKPDGVLTASIVPPRGLYRNDEAVRGLLDRVLGRIASLPNVTDASFTSVLPLSGQQLMFSFAIEGQPRPQLPTDGPVASFRSVGLTFFQTLGLSLVEGRLFTADDRTDAPMVAVVNRTLVRRYFGGKSPIGQRVSLGGSRATIVGVVGDVQHAGPAATPDAEMFVPYGQLGSRSGWLVIRTSADPAALAPLVRQATHDIDAKVPLALVRPMPALVAASVAQARFLATVLSAFSFIAAALALVGVYGLLEFAVSRRTREIGVRIALGATRRSVVALVLRQSLVVVALGVAVGAAAGAGAATVVRALLFQVTPGDPATVATMGAAIFAATLMATIRPARRAAGVDPVVALRDE